MRKDDRRIGPHAPPDGRDWENQCARCGSSVASEECEGCGGAGDVEEHDVDYDEEPYFRTCEDCGGTGTYHVCLSSPGWCEANPLPGRENVKRGEIEWYTFEAKAR